MAIYPEAIFKPITVNKGRQNMYAYNRMNLHVAVSEASSLYGAFNRKGQPDSHFYVRRGTADQLTKRLPATVEQYVDTKYRANADLEGNDATLSVETQGGTKKADSEPWDISQLLAMADLFEWAMKTHGIKEQLAWDSKIGNSSHGLSWHRLGVDGNFPALPNIGAGRLQRGGGMRYSKSRGKLCLPTDSTEILTRGGWVALPKVTYEMEVASWDPTSRDVVYEKPLDILEPFESDTVKVGPFESTPDHEWYEDGVKVPAEDLDPRTKHPTFQETYSGLPLTDNQVRLMTWLFADGHFMKETRVKSGTPTVIGVEWHFSKERKRDRLVDLLTDIGIVFSNTTQSDGTFKIRVYGDEAREKIIWLLPSKKFTPEILGMSKHQLDILWSSLKETDGASTVDKMIVFSKDETSLKLLQAASLLNGWDATMWKSGGIHWMIRRKTNRTVGQVVPNRTTEVSCITTRTGSLVIRQAGATVVTGNCPGLGKIEQIPSIFATATVGQVAKPTPPKPPVVAPPKPAPTPKPKPNLRIDGWWGTSTTRAVQAQLGTPVDGEVSGQPYTNKNPNPGLVQGWKWSVARKPAGSLMIKELQRQLKAKGFYKGAIDGWFGPANIAALQRALGTFPDGKVSKQSNMVKQLQTNLNAGKLF